MSPSAHIGFTPTKAFFHTVMHIGTVTSLITSIWRYENHARSSQQQMLRVTFIAMAREKVKIAIVIHYHRNKSLT